MQLAILFKAVPSTGVLRCPLVFGQWMNLLLFSSFMYKTQWDLIASFEKMKRASKRALFERSSLSLSPQYFYIVFIGIDNVIIFYQFVFRQRELWEPGRPELCFTCPYFSDAGNRCTFHKHMLNEKKNERHCIFYAKKMGFVFSIIPFLSPVLCCFSNLPLWLLNNLYFGFS